MEKEKKEPPKKRTADDSMIYPGEPTWMKHGKNQRIISRSYERIEPTAKVISTPTQIDFNFKDDNAAWRMGPNTYFEVTGQFQVKTPADNTVNPPVVEVDWKGIDPEESDQFTIEPNFFESLIRKLEIRHNEILINTDD